MLRLTATFAVLYLLGAASGAPRSIFPVFGSRIVGGENTTIEDYPYMLGLLAGGYDDLNFCGAVLISSLWAVTAAHCVEAVPNNLKVRAGSTYQTSGGQVVTVLEVTVHPGYGVAASFDSDIAVLQLSEPITISTAKPIPLRPASQPITEGETGIITGWGSIVYGGSYYPEILQVVEVPTVSQDICISVYGEDLITDNMFCAGLWEVGGKDACQGDSGGPVVINQALSGLVSFGSGCAWPDYPGVYTSIPPLADWISGILESN